MMSAMLAMSPAAFARTGKGSGGGAGIGAAAISGVVRDAQGVAQMGALVQVLAANSMTVGTAFTDQHGRYVIANLSPGKYLVRASATLFVPTQKANLQLRTGATAVVNLTLAALFDTASWLPAQRRRADETEDDWKWTLRSTANRPILRIVEDGETIEVSSSASETPESMRVKALGAVESGDGGFGQGGVHNIVTMHRGLDDGSDLMMRADVGTSTRGSQDQTGSAAASNEFDLGYEGKTGFNGGASRTVVSYQAHPELVGSGFLPGMQGGVGYQAMEINSAQRMSLGEHAELEAGGRMVAVKAGDARVASHPFVRVSAHPTGEWTIEYRLATDRGLQEFDDVTTAEGDVPVALVRNGKLALESGHHQALSVAHRTGRASFQAAYYRDGFSNVVVQGGEAARTALPDATVSDSALVQAIPLTVPNGMLLDPTTGTFRALAAGYKTSGLRLTASSAITPSLWIAAEYSSGDALSTGPAGLMPMPTSFADALTGLQARWSQTATVAIKGRILKSGTRVRASYRWQPVSGVTAVDPYSAFGDQAYLSCLIRQTIRIGHMAPPGLEATIDVTNLMAQGYRPFLSADGQTLYFAQSPRTIQAGLSFTF